MAKKSQRRDSSHRNRSVRTFFIKSFHGKSFRKELKFCGCMPFYQNFNTIFWNWRKLISLLKRSSSFFKWDLMLSVNCQAGNADAKLLYIYKKINLLLPKLLSFYKEKLQWQIGAMPAPSWTWPVSLIYINLRYRVIIRFLYLFTCRWHFNSVDVAFLSSLFTWFRLRTSFRTSGMIPASCLWYSSWIEE